MDFDFLVGIAFFAVVYGIFHLYVRRKERLALIEKGLTANIFNSEANVSPSLKYGIFCIGIAIGFLLGNILAKNTNLEEGVAYVSMIFLFGGIGLVFYYFIAKKHVRKE
jgi:predicted MFS family arabinose efflux permease